MWIGVRISEEGYQRWSSNDIGYWRDYTTDYKSLIIDLSDGGTGKSGYQDYLQVMALQLHRWNDDY